MENQSNIHFEQELKRYEMNFINLVFSSPKLEEQLKYKPNINFVRSPLFIKLTNNEIEEANEYVKSLKSSYTCSLFENAKLEENEAKVVSETKAQVKNPKRKARKRNRKHSRGAKKTQIERKLSYADVTRNLMNK